MHLERYHLKADDRQLHFEFSSVGVHGAIRKAIEFQATSVVGFYNLAFGDKTLSGEIDDLAVSNNGDTEKVLATVAAALYRFFELYPDAVVYATGSTPARTRLYRMGITKFYDVVENDFYLFGRKDGRLYPFELGADYDGFFASRKID